MNALSYISVNALLLAINLTLIGSLLAVSVAITFRFAKNVHPRIRYMVAIAAFFASVTLPVLATFQVFEKQKSLVLTVNTIENDLTKDAVRETSNGFLARPIVEDRFRSELFLDEAPAANRLDLEVSPQFLVGLLTLWFVVALVLIAR